MIPASFQMTWFVYKYGDSKDTSITQSCIYSYTELYLQLQRAVSTATTATATFVSRQCIQGDPH
jgi:hypothetical protein